MLVNAAGDVEILKDSFAMGFDVVVNVDTAVTSMLDLEIVVALVDGIVLEEVVVFVELLGDDKEEVVGIDPTEVL